MHRGARTQRKMPWLDLEWQIIKLTRRALSVEGMTPAEVMRFRGAGHV